MDIQAIWRNHVKILPMVKQNIVLGVSLTARERERDTGEVTGGSSNHMWWRGSRILGIRFTMLGNTEFGVSSHHNIEYCIHIWRVENLASNSEAVRFTNGRVSSFELTSSSFELPSSSSSSSCLIWYLLCCPAVDRDDDYRPNPLCLRNRKSYSL